MDVCPPAYIRRQCLLFLCKLPDSSASSLAVVCRRRIKIFMISVLRLVVFMLHLPSVDLQILL